MGFGALNRNCGLFSVFSSVNAILEKKPTHFFHVEILKLRDPRVLKRLKFFWIRWVFKLSTPMSHVPCEASVLTCVLVTDYFTTAHSFLLHLLPL